jgi:hypothetical protein
VHVNIQWDNPWQVAANVVASAVQLWAVVRLVQTPIDHFAHGNRSRALRIVAALGVCISIAGVVIPAGAMWLLNNPPLRRSELSQ